MMPLFIIEFRPLRYLLLVLIVGVLRGAAHGDWQALVILSMCVVLLWWRPLLDAVRQMQEAAYKVRVFVEWAWGWLFR